MPRVNALTAEFVESFPQALQDGCIYVSMEYATAVHLCCCGCGNHVYTPISPTDWQLAYNGIGVSLYPSIGNWNFPCQSHYWIERGRVRWAPKWTKEEIAAGRARDWSAKQRYYDGLEPEAQLEAGVPGQSLFARLWRLLWG